MGTQRGKRQQDGVLKGHYRTGRVYRPPLMAYPETVVGDWIRDDLPDLIWPAVLIAAHGELGLMRFCRFQQAAKRALEENGGTDAVTLDGRLTSLELTPLSDRDRLYPIVLREIEAADLLSVRVRSVLRLYGNFPGAWLLDKVEDFEDSPMEDAGTLCAKAISSMSMGGHPDALLKFVTLAWDVINGKLSMGREMIDILKNYPGVKSEHPLADSMIRSSFGARKGAEGFASPELAPVRIAWAKKFWEKNWQMSSCMPHEEAEVTADKLPDHEEDGSSGVGGSDAEVGEVPDPSPDDEGDFGFAGAVGDLFNRFLGEALSPELGLDLHAPEKHEVVSGLITRAARSVMSVMHAPHQWSGEHGSAVTRLLAETEILLCWLDHKGEDFYKKYQLYGLGKVKMMSIRMKGLAEKFPDGAPEFLDEAIEKMSERLGGSIGQEFIEVDTGSTFSGASIRQMAIDAGMKDFYDEVYQVASGVVHGEWWTIEDYSMQRCVNPLHRFHWIPSYELGYVSDERMPNYWLRALERLIDLGLAHLKGQSGDQVEAKGD